MLVFLGVLFLACSQVFWEALLTAWLTMLAVSYAFPQLVYRRTSAHWLVPFAALLRAMALIVRPIEAMITFFETLVDMTDERACDGGDGAASGVVGEGRVGRA